MSEKTKKRTVTMVYRPADADPPVTTWNRIKFRANEPVELDRDNPAHFIVQLLRTETRNPQTGGIAYEYLDGPVFMGDAAQGNPSWEIDGVRTRRMKVQGRTVPPPGDQWGHENEGEIVYADNYPTDIAADADSVVVTARR